MGKVTCFENRIGVEVVYYTGRGKMQREIYREVFIGKTEKQVGEAVGKRVEEIRAQTKPTKFVPAT